MKKGERKFHSCQYREDKDFMCALECYDDCPIHPDYEDCWVEDEYEDLEEIEALYQSGELEPDKAKTYEMGKNYGYNIGLAEGSSSNEDCYIEGYKDCFLGEEPCIYDEDLEELLEQNNSFSVDNMIYDTDFLDYVKELQDKISKLHKYSDNSEFRKEIYDIFHLITVITENQVMKPVYQYWVDLEDR